MPIVARDDQTKGGRHVVRCQVSGHVSGADANGLLEQSKALAAKVGTKGDLLCNVAAGTDYSPESRRIFTKEFTPYTRRTAAVVSSKIVRAAINFMMRMANRNTELMCFDDEESAIAWLDS
ncbi:MAG TPA: STAS/SEC14 domain-containing protein [Polyangium sp.]|nr:STAS/SEC14 domain-containing protein [Polyangium sp.]